MGPVRLEAITWERLGDLLAERLLDLKPDDGSPWPRIAVDGAPAARPGDLAHRSPRRCAYAAGPRSWSARRASCVPRRCGFEYGREDVESYYNGWFDTGALWREVFGALEPGGTGRVLPDLWDPAADRATRSPYVQLPPGGLLLLHGPLPPAALVPVRPDRAPRCPRARCAAVPPRPSTGPCRPSRATRARRDPAGTADVLVRATTPGIRPGTAALVTGLRPACRCGARYPGAGPGRAARM